MHKTQIITPRDQNMQMDKWLLEENKISIPSKNYLFSLHNDI
jgi:hypothetical protein